MISTALKTPISIPPTQLTINHKRKMKSVSILRMIRIKGSNSSDQALLVGDQVIVLAERPVAAWTGLCF